MGGGIIDPLLPADNGQTPLSEEELEGLIPSYITLRPELNEAEQGNLIEAEEWAFKRTQNVLDIDFLNVLHKRMFGRVWNWAGTFRTTGNGRHARLAADLLLGTLGQPRFTWGSRNLTDPGRIRALCIEALRAADNHDYGALLTFVRS